MKNFFLTVLLATAIISSTGTITFAGKPNEPKGNSFQQGLITISEQREIYRHRINELTNEINAEKANILQLKDKIDQAIALVNQSTYQATQTMIELDHIQDKIDQAITLSKQAASQTNAELDQVNFLVKQTRICNNLSLIHI